MQKTILTSLATCLLSLAACGDASTAFDEGMLVDTQPVGLDSSLFFVDQNGNRGYLLDGSKARPSASATRVALPYGPTHAERRKGTNDEALVLCAGRRSSADATAKNAGLAAVGHDGKVRTYELGTTPFDTLVQSDDGRYALLFHGKPEAGRLLNNANELAIVDLDAKPGTDGAVTPKTPASFGHTPTGAVFSPTTMRINEEDRRLLVVLSAAEVTLIDLNHLDRRETVVQLGATGSGNINPEQVLFGTSEPTLYIRGSGSDDIFMFRLEPHPNDPLGNDFRPSINQLGGGSGPRDMALFSTPQPPGTPQSPRLLVLSQGNTQAIVLDPSSSKATPIALPGPATHILLFTAGSPTDKKEQPRALLYSDGAGVFFLDLADIETRKERNLDFLALDASVASVIPLTDENKLAVLHPGTGVSVLDLAQRTITPITSGVALGGAVFDADAKRLWVAPADQDRVGTLDLDTGATNEVLLDDTIVAVVPLFAAKRFAVVHPSAVGYVTFLNSTTPSRDTATSVRGFLIANALDRGAP